MTTTSNIVINVAAWQTSHSYIVGALVTNSSNAYLCITGGTSASSGGPTTTSLNITDNTVHWQYLCAVNYTSLTSWASGIPGTLTQPVVGQVLAGAAIDITTPASTPYLSLSGHGTTPTNTITLMPFPGFGINTVIGAGTYQPVNPFSSDFSADFGGGPAIPQPGAFNASAINFLAPVTPAGSVNYFDITDANVIFNGLQFKDQGAASSCTLIKTETGASNFLVTDCIIDGYAQSTGASILVINSQGLITNSLIVDRQAAANTNPPIVLSAGNASHFVNNTLRKINGESGGTTTAINWSTTTGAILRNNAVYGYAKPFGSGVGGSATADHNVSDASTFVSAGLTVGSGNVAGTLATNQFIDPATDFRLLASAACVKAGVADTTDIPSAADIVGHNRVEWDAGAFALFIVASTITSIVSIVPVIHASIVATDAASAIVSIPPRVAVISAGQQAIATAARNINLTAVGVSGQKDQASAAVNVSGMAVVSTVRIEIQASGGGTAETLVAIGFLNDVAGGIVNIPPPVCIAFATAIGAANAIGLCSFNVATTASMSSLTNASGMSNTDLGSLIRAGQEERASATVSFGTMLATGVAAQFDIISAVSVSLPAMVCVAVIGFSCNALVRLLAVAASATMAQAGQATGRASLLTITIPTPVQTKLQADPSASIFLLADGSGLILQADVPRARSLTEATSTSSTSTIPPIVCVGLAFESDVATSTRNVLTMAAVGAFGQADLAVGSASVVLGVSSQAVQQRASNTLATLASLQAVVTAGQSDGATSTGTLALVAVGAAQQVDQAHSTTNVNMAVVATGGPTLIWSGTVSLPPMAAVITMANVNGAHGSASIILAVAGTLTSSTSVSATDAVTTMAVAASAILTTPATAAVAIPAIVAVAALGQSDAAVGSSAVVLRCAAVLNNASVNAATLATVPPLVAAGTAQNFILSASALAAIRFGVLATASLNGAQMAGSGTITISATSATGQANFAATLASLAVLAETNATLYVSPTEFEPGDQIIYWSA